MGCENGFAIVLTYGLPRFSWMLLSQSLVRRGHVCNTVVMHNSELIVPRPERDFSFLSNVELRSFRDDLQAE
jgi:hypothetical protein